MRSLIANRLTQDVTLHIRTAGNEDDHGNPADTETDQIVKGFLSQQTAAEGVQGQVVQEGMVLFLAHDAPIDGWDAATVDGARYEVIGAPWQVWNPRTSEVSHVRAGVRRGGTQ